MKLSIHNAGTLLLLGTLLSLLTGCGGGASKSLGGASSGPAASAQLATVHLLVKWPSPTPIVPATAGANPHYIPANAHSVVVTAYTAADFGKPGAAPVVPTVVVVPGSSGSLPASQAISNLPINTPLIFHIESHPNADGSGTALSEADTPAATLKAGDNGNLTPVTLGSTVTAVTILPNNPLLVIKGINLGADLNLSAQATDGSGNVVLTEPGTISFQFLGTDGNPVATAPSFVTIAPINDQKTGLPTGTVTVHPVSPNAQMVRAVFTASDKSFAKEGTPITLTVKTSRSITGSGGVSYLLDTTLAFGNWGQGPSSFAQPNSVAAVQDAAGHKILFTEAENATDVYDLYNLPVLFNTNSLPGGTGSVFTADDNLGFYAATGNSINVYHVTVSPKPNTMNVPLFTGVDFGSPVAVIPSPGSITAVAVDTQQDVFFASGGSVYEAKLASGAYSAPASIISGVSGTITGLAVAPDGGVYVVAGTVAANGLDNGGFFVLGYATSTQVLKYALAGDAYQPDPGFGVNGVLPQVAGWQCIAVNSSSNQPTSGNIYVTAPTTNRIAQFDQFGDYINDLNTPVADQQLNARVLTTGVFHPLGISVASDGTVWVAENGRSQDFTHIPNPVYDNRFVAFTPASGG